MSEIVELNWHQNARIVVESLQGLTPARLRGIAEAAGDVLVFVDDDNILAPDFLEVCRSKAEQLPKMGVWGGHIEPEFESPPPVWTRPLWSYLALREVRQDYYANSLTATKAEPCGAGLCIRREAALKYAQMVHSDPGRSALDRKGRELTSAGDTDMVWTTLAMGFGMAMFKDLRLTHIMPAWRLTEEYLVRLSEGLRFSHLVLRYQWKLPMHIPPRNLTWYLRYIYRYCTLWGRNRKFYMANVRAENRALQHITGQL